MLMLNALTGPTIHVRVRRAIAHAIDRNLIVEALLKGYARVVDEPMTPANFGWVDGLKSYDYDPAAAKSLLKEAGVAPRTMDVGQHTTASVEAAQPRPWGQYYQKGCVIRELSENRPLRLRADAAPPHEWRRSRQSPQRQPSLLPGPSSVAMQAFPRCLGASHAVLPSRRVTVMLCEK